MRSPSSDHTGKTSFDGLNVSWTGCATEHEPPDVESRGLGIGLIVDNAGAVGRQGDRADDTAGARTFELMAGSIEPHELYLADSPCEVCEGPGARCREQRLVGDRTQAHPAGYALRDAADVARALIECVCPECSCLREEDVSLRVEIALIWESRSRSRLPAAASETIQTPAFPGCLTVGTNSRKCRPSGRRTGTIRRVVLCPARGTGVPSPPSLAAATR